MYLVPTKKPKRRFFTRQFETIFFVILILSVFSILLLFTINDIFPNNGGFTRNIFFVKSVEPDTPAYFIIIDEINPTNSRIPVDWLLHGRGNLSIFNNNQSALWEVESYLNPHHIVKLHVIFIQPEVTISKSAGPFYPTQSYVDNPITVHYIKARPTLTGSMHIVTLLIPLNGTQHLPNLTRDAESGVTYIGDRDLIFTQNSVSLKTFDNYTTNAEILFIRRNNSEILSYILKNGNYFSQNSQVFLKAENTISVNLEYQASSLSGLCWVNTPTQISLWVPNTPKQVLFNGQDLSHTYNPANQTTTFNIPQNGSLFLSFNPFKSFEQKNPSYESPTSRSQPIFPSTSRAINYGIHPILYFNESNLSSLRSKILTQQPWLNWFLRLESNAIGHLSDNISSLGADNRAEPALNLAFSGVIRQNLTYINKAKQFLLAMDEITAYFSHLRRGRACSHYALAFDMIYPNLSATERAEIAEKLENHTLPLIQKFPALPQNNHIGVVASGIGLSGLVLEKNDWVSLATTGIDTYFSTCFTAEGGNFEGYSYAGYFLESGLKFFYGLKNAGGKNYFANPTFLSFINHTIYSLTPLTTATLFEDCTTNPQIIEDLLWAAPSVHAYEPLLCNYSQWIYNKRQLNDALSYDGTYLDSSESWTSGLVTRLCLYSFNITPVQPPLEPLSIWSEVGHAFFRSDWSPNAIYLSISCKNRPDYLYHAHYDENSFELWAYGAWLAANPGYPGYGYGEYDRIIQTEASNTLLFNGKGQQRVNGDGFREHFSSTQVDGLVASANSIYSSPGNYAVNEYFLGVLIFLFTNLVIVSLLSVHLRHRAYKTKIFFFPTETPSRFSTIKFKNFVLKTHLLIALGLIFGVISSLVSFFLFTNTYIEGYLVGQHAEIVNLIPIIEISLIIISIPLLILILSFKFKLQQKIVRRVATFSSNLPPSDIPSLKDSIKISYFPQIFFLLIFIPIMLFFYTPILEDVVNHIFTEGGSLIDIQNYIIGALNQYIWLFALTLLLYLPFKIIGLYLGGQILSEKLSQPTSDGILMLTIGYLLTLTIIILAIFCLSLTFFYVLNWLGVSFIV